MNENPRVRASESVAERFTRNMNAATSPYGVLSDLTIASAVAAIPIVLLVRQAAAGELSSPLTYGIALVAVLPIASAIGVSIALRNAREDVVSFLAEQPFPIDNVNTLLVGLSDDLDIEFAETAKIPAREELQRRLDAVSDDALATDVDVEKHTASIKIGVIDSQRVPLRSAFLRWDRFRRIVREILVPLAKEAPIVAVRVR